MSSKFCKNQLYSSYILGFFITKLYTIVYYLHYFLLFSKVTYYFVWRNLPTNSNYFTKIYLLFSVTLIIIQLTFEVLWLRSYSIELMTKLAFTPSYNDKQPRLLGAQLCTGGGGGPAPKLVTSLNLTIFSNYFKKYSQN